MKIALLILALSCCLMNDLPAQGIIIMKNGDEITVKVTEVSSQSIRYKKFDNPEGPLYTADKNDVFMIKYQNGTKDIFGQQNPPEQRAEGDGSATFYFYRPRKLASSSAKIIVGTAEPDEVVVKLKNGSWYRTDYTHIGERHFVAGVYVINPQFFIMNVEAGKTYYVKCTLLSKGFKIMAEMEMTDEEAAKAEMAGLKEQTRSYVN